MCSAMNKQECNTETSINPVPSYKNDVVAAGFIAKAKTPQYVTDACKKESVLDLSTTQLQTTIVCEQLEMCQCQTDSKESTPFLGSHTSHKVICIFSSM